MKKKDEIKNKEIFKEEMEELKQEELEKENQAKTEEETIEEPKEETNDLEKQLENANKEIEELKNAYARKNAEFQNFARRKENEFEELKKYAAEKIIAKFLEGVDNLERAISASLESKDFDSLVKGVDMTLNQIKNTLKSEGVEEIKAVGEKFDPYKHQAVMVENIEDVENDYIVMELQKGYTMHGKVIRPSMVKVCKK
ncbi:molecular chaperone GrpE [Hypnocyclicus thermotrophus]|uniref:Protein GrpE n=1 Tax=Hypnocyclicus thermotrophus TaxID=1627895 RepID=A0AA46DYR0_9FUSO|nr:nucleotide exchange factor GrpE [Hypnocyclicus thermotrophus]TDT70512.1 molecular chaperone GrpE [Hypnocyclicus thermotrophus]